MKNFKFLFIGVLIAAAMTSCNSIWDFEDPYTFDPTTYEKSKTYKGGNVECYQLNLDLGESTGRNNYDAKLYGNANGGFQSAWPEGLFVRVENGTEVSFFMSGSIKIGETCYKVGAVIVKGGNGSNVYTYGEGAEKDKNLVPPDNSSGAPAGLSNLTFCFVEVDCEVEEPTFIAVKSLYWDGDVNDWSKYTWNASVGSYVFTTEAGYWCNFTGLNPFESSTFNLHKDYNLNDIVGTVTISKGANSSTVTIDLNDGLTLDKTYLFVGTLEEFKGTSSTEFPGCPDYETWLFKDDNLNSVTYELNY